MCLIFSASADSQSVAHTSQIIGPLCHWLFPNVTFSQVETVQFIVRKSAHMTEFALLAVLLLYALAAGKGDARKWISSAWVLAVAYAAADEFHQLFVPGRNGSVVDVGIDAAGAALGLLVAAQFLRFRAQRQDVASPATQSEPQSEPTTLLPSSDPESPPLQRPSYADQLLYTLEGQDFENRTQVRLSVQDRLQREHGGRLVLGRSREEAQLCLKNTSVSARHLALTFHSGQFEIEDLGSSNGTRLNGRKLTPMRPALLADGDRIEAGEVLLHFRRLA
jgi:VanZ family protein